MSLIALSTYDRLSIAGLVGKSLVKISIKSFISAPGSSFTSFARRYEILPRSKQISGEWFFLNDYWSKATREASADAYPSMEMARHAFNYMPEDSDIERRNKALFAFLMLTGARDGAVASSRLKHINMIDDCVYQDAREVKTKNAKTFTTYFLPVDPEYLTCFEDWVTYLKRDKLFGPDDPLFPPAKIRPTEGEFKVVGLERGPYKNANAIRSVIKEAFTRADLPPFTPHAFRKTLVKWADTRYPTREAFKAFSQNIGHTCVITTVSAYCPVSNERQAELIKSS